VVNGPLEIDNFIKHVVETSQTRVYQALSMRGVGGSVPNTPDVTLDRLKSLLNPEAIAQAALNNKPVVVGIKGRLIPWKQYVDSPEERESIIMQMALEASKRAQVPLLLHYTGPKHPMPEILKMLRKGDVMTHTFNPLENGILDANGKILPAMREARQRGVLFDVGAYHVSYFSFDVMEKALQQDFPPDTISSDIHSSFTTMYPLDDFPIVASKFFALGMKLDDIIERVTIRAAQAFPFASHSGTTGIGTLKPGSEADIGLFELQEGTFNWVDTIPPKSQPGLKVGRRVGHQRLVNTATVCRGKLWVNQADV
jgi:dihydroorotase